MLGLGEHIMKMKYAFVKDPGLQCRFCWLGIYSDMSTVNSEEVYMTAHNL